MKLYDAHSHLHFPENSDLLSQFKSDGDIVACDSSVSFKDMDALHEIYLQMPSRIVPAYGIHPWCVPAFARKFDYEQLEEFLGEAKAIGEIGLDNKCDVDFDAQLLYFKAQIDIACERELPMILHSIKAWRELLEVLEGRKIPQKFLVHAASCPLDIAKRLQDMGAMFSFGTRELGTMKGLACATNIKIDNILIESDGACIRQDLEKALKMLAELRNETRESMSEIVESNFIRLFGNV